MNVSAAVSFNGGWNNIKFPIGKDSEQYCQLPQVLDQYGFTKIDVTFVGSKLDPNERTFKAFIGLDKNSRVYLMKIDGESRSNVRNLNNALTLFKLKGVKEVQIVVENSHICTVADTIYIYASDKKTGTLLVELTASQLQPSK